MLVVRTAFRVSEKVAHGGLIAICKYVISPVFLKIKRIWYSKFNDETLLSLSL